MVLTTLEMDRLAASNWRKSDYVISIRKRLTAAGLKFCLPCRAILPIDNFHDNSSCCKPCNAKASNRSYHKNREVVLARRAVYAKANEEALTNMDPDEQELDPSDLLDDSLYVLDDDDNYY